MKTRAILNLGLSALIAAGAVAATTAMTSGAAFAGARDEATIAKQAAASAAKAQKLFAKGRVQQAVAPAETAVSLQPRDLSYRWLLAQTYLKAGRFGSAQAAYADVLTLDPGNAKAALNLALTQIAEGQWDGARRTLDAHAAGIPAADRGLAIALAGDPAGAVDVLITAARMPGSDAKTRQNLALAMALAGRWQEARTIAEADVGPAAIDARMIEWAAFAQPKGASDQVASLLGVKPAADPGRPVALALNAAPPVAVPSAAPVATAAVVAVPVVPVAVPVIAPVSFAPPRAMVQALPVAAVKVAAPKTIVAGGAFKTKLAAAPVRAVVRPPAKGDWFVQIGAFDSPVVAKDAWGRATRRYAAFRTQTPTGMSFAANGANFYRLSLGGFARADATALCRGYRARGGTCFVRQGAGDQMALWLRPNVQVAKATAKKPVQLASR